MLKREFKRLLSIPELKNRYYSSRHSETAKEGINAVS